MGVPYRSEQAFEGGQVELVHGGVQGGFDLVVAGDEPGVGAGHGLQQSWRALGLALMPGLSPGLEGRVVGAEEGLQGFGVALGGIGEGAEAVGEIQLAGLQ